MRFSAQDPQLCLLHDSRQIQDKNKTPNAVRFRYQVCTIPLAA